jgi:hypothetical protein
VKVKSQNKLAAAQLVVDKEKARQQKLMARRTTRELVKALRVMADMLEGGEIVEWSIDRNFGYNTFSWAPYRDRPDEMRRNGRDELKMTFRYSLDRFAKRLRRRKPRPQ